jgi:catechol 2,3-dioxygenase
VSLGPTILELGPVGLTVRDLPRALEFYVRTLGLCALDGSTDEVAVLAAPGGPPLLELHGDPAAVPPGRGRPGLYHVALLVPDRVELARSLLRLARRRWPLSGASDHLVSEALYLDDPEGNGIEIYSDRPREKWPRGQRGEVRMATLPLDLDGLLGELDPDSAGDDGQPPMASATRVGHVHLQVSDLRDAEDFYVAGLGLEVTVRTYPGALFLATGGYHHHIGLNTWHSAGSEPAPAPATGLRSFRLRLSGAQAAAARLAEAGRTLEQTPGGTLTRDPSGNAVLLSI